MLHKNCTKWEKPTGETGDQWDCNMMQPIVRPVLENVETWEVIGGNAINCTFHEGITVHPSVNTGQISYCANHPINKDMPLISCPVDCEHVKGEPLEVENADGSISTIYNYYQSIPL